MSAATKRKHVISEFQKDDPNLPLPHHQIVKVKCSRGNNIHEVLAPDGSSFLVSMPKKFRRNLWIKREDYILVEPINEGNQIKAEMVALLTSNYIKFLKTENAWPIEFGDYQPNSDNEDDLFVNPNRQVVERRVSSSESETTDSEGEDEE